MKKLITRFPLLLFFLLLSASLSAQRIVNVDVYVSKQTSNPGNIKQGSYPASADEGRYIDVEVEPVEGPIDVQPRSFQLMGPACPTYANGVRTPATPAAPNRTNFQGTLSCNEIPDPGQQIHGDFTVKDNGYWTRCRTGQRVPYDTSVKVIVQIKSINLVLEAADKNVCINRADVLNVQTRFPDNLGTVTYRSVGGKFTVTGTNTRCTITGTQQGDDVLEATFTVQGVTFKANCNIHIFGVAFSAASINKPWYAGGNINCNTMLRAPAPNAADLEWALVAPIPAGAAIDAATGVLTFPNVRGQTVIVKVRPRNTQCWVQANVVLFGFTIVMNGEKVGGNASTCDGKTYPVQVKPVPNTLPANVLTQIQNLELESEVVGNFGGNPANENELDFGAFDAQFRSTIANVYWFANQANECNRSSVWRIKASGTVNGNAVTANNQPTLTARFDYPQCFEGTAAPVRFFTGAPVFQWVQVRPGLARAIYFNAGNFVRAVQGAVTVAKFPPNSQFKDLLLAEENFHVGQIQNDPLTNDLWNPNNVIAMIQNGVWVGANGAQAMANAAAAFVRASQLEIQRGMAMFCYPCRRRCLIEKQAKAAVNATFIAKYTCSYPLCQANWP